MPRKSDIGTDIKGSAGNGAGGSGGGVNTKDGLSIDDQTLPKSIVTRLAKGVLPQNTNVQKDAIIALSKGGTVFINYLCATANDQAKLHGRKTINPKDILEAMQIMEFKDFLPRLKAELEKFNEMALEKRAATKKPVKPKDNANIQSPSTSDKLPSEELNQASDCPPATKKIRVDDAGTDSHVNQANRFALTGHPALARGWGDEDEDDQEMEAEDDEPDEVEETGSEGLDEEESDEPPEEENDTEVGHAHEEDEALDNGVDSD